VSFALLTAARADARFASRVAVLTLELVDEPPAPLEEAEEGVAVWLVFVGCALVVVVLLLGEFALGATVVVVLAGELAAGVVARVGLFWEVVVGVVLACPAEAIEA
jgi:hypothetical protein